MKVCSSIACGLAAVVAAVTLQSCTLPFAQMRCDDIVVIEDGPDSAADAVTHACQRYAAATGVSPPDIRRALAGTHIYFTDDQTPADCTDSPACVRVTSTTAHIYIRHRGWRSVLPHEIHHILLTRHEPDLPFDQHHRRMKQLGL